MRRRGSSGRRNGISAGLGGVGSGTGLVGIAHLVGLTTVAGQVLLYVAPVLAVVFGALVYQLEQWATWYGEQIQARLDRRAHEERGLEIKRARKTLEDQLNDPNVSDESKRNMKTLLDQMDRVVAEAELAHVKALVK